MLAWLRARAAEAETVTSVCTGSMLLGVAGLLDGLHATTHWRSLDWMRDSFPAVTVEYGKHFVKDGRVFTSAGISAGIDMSLMVVARRVTTDAHARYFGTELNDESLTSGDSPRIGPTRFEDWLSRSTVQR